MKSNKFKLLFLISTILLLPVFCLANESFPSFPMAFWGDATLNNEPLPAGTIIKAYCNNNLVGEIIMVENGIYGYTEAAKNKLLVSNCDNNILFKYLPLGGNEDLAGGIEVKYTEGFISGTTKNKDLDFINNKTIPNESGVATISSTTPQVVITNPVQAVTVTISSGTTNPTIDVSSFITGGTGIIPQITITAANAGNANVAIPASTTVTSADPAWNGVIAAPTATTVTLPTTAGETKILSMAIEIGFTGAKLSFDKAVRLLLPGQAGKRAGYIRTGTTFTEITSICAADNQATGNTLAADGDCKISVGSDLIIWTKHFTSFATYTQTAMSTPASTSGGGGGGGGGGGATTPTYKTGDVNKDSKVDKYDFALIMANWGKTGTNTCDFNNDGKVDKYDFALLMLNWSI